MKIPMRPRGEYWLLAEIYIYIGGLPTVIFFSVLFHLEWLGKEEQFRKKDFVLDFLLSPLPPTEAGPVRYCPNLIAVKIPRFSVT